MTTTLPWLSVSVFVPIIAGILVLIFGRDSRAQYTRSMAAVGALLSLLVTLPVVFGFQSGTADMQFVEDHSWIEALNIHYHLGVDGISLWFVLLTPLMTLLVILATWHTVQDKIAQYLASFLILCGIMVGLFCAQDGLLFYVFFEASLIPIYLIIGIWGGPERFRAAIKFFLYTLLGSLLSLVAFIYLFTQTSTFDIASWQQAALPLQPQMLIFFALFAAFAIKIPMWPLHSWLPDAYSQSPAGATAMMSALMVKMGAYGFLRFSLPITPDAVGEVGTLMITLALIGLIYISLVAIAQRDMLRVVAYASIAHMAAVALGIFLLNPAAELGALTHMVSHALVAGALLLSIGMLRDRFGTTEIGAYSGLARLMPKFACLFVLFSMANTGLPGTSGFVGEFFVIMGAVSHNFWTGSVMAFSIILSAVYSLWLVKRVIFGAPRQHGTQPAERTADIHGTEFLVLGALAVLILVIGVYPQIITAPMQASLDHLLQLASQSKL